MKRPARKLMNAFSSVFIVSRCVKRRPEAIYTPSNIPQPMDWQYK